MRSVVRITVATLLTASGLHAQAPVSTNVIRRLDGTTISVAEADSFARKTLEAAHVTGAQLAILDRGKLVWSAAYGLRRRDPRLPMERGDLGQHLDEPRRDLHPSRIALFV